MKDSDPTPSDGLAHQTAECCDLRFATSAERRECDGKNCIYWRVLEHLDVDRPEATGCAIRYFGMLHDADPEVGKWLLSVKERMDALNAEDTAQDSPAR